MLEALNRTGWHNYSSSSLRRPLFGYFETSESFAAAPDGMSREEVNARWQAEMSSLEEPGARHDDGGACRGVSPGLSRSRLPSPR